MRGKAGEPRSLGEVRIEAGNHLGPPVVKRMRLPWGVQRTDSGVQWNRMNGEKERTKCGPEVSALGMK